MEPFTVEGLAKIEGEIVEDDRCEEKDKDDIEKETIEVPGSTVYNLVGVVVHSGQASGGHYYSYIIPRFVQQKLHEYFPNYNNDLSTQGTFSHLKPRARGIEGYVSTFLAARFRVKLSFQNICNDVSKLSLHSKMHIVYGSQTPFVVI